MPDQISAHITIGGTVATELVATLCQAIRDESLGLEWCGEAFEPRCREDLLNACKALGKTRVLQLFDDSAAWGQFPVLEGFFVQHRIPFDRQHEAKFEIAATKLLYRPETGAQEFITNVHGEIVTPARPLTPVGKMLAQAQSDLNLGHNREAGALVAECIAKLKDNLPPELPALPEFQIEPA